VPPEAGAVAAGAPADPVIRLEQVSVVFDGFRALDRMDFSMARGELRVVIGPNGAGKTSLLDVISGKVVPESGRVIFDGGVDLVGRPPHRIASLGIARKFQTPAVFPGHTVFENVLLALRGDRGLLRALTAPVGGTCRLEVLDVLERVGLADEARRLAGTLSHGQKQWLEIGMLIAQRPRLLLLDEPAAGMTGLERERTVRLVEAIAAGRSVLVIEHDMEFVRELARTVTVLHAGSVLCEGSLAEVQSHPAVVEVYLGRGQALADA
jgi:urea transport system ATP-binding protein